MTYYAIFISWNTHVDYIVKKADKRLFSLRVLRKAGVQQADLIEIYCSLIRSVLEYAAPVWACLPDYLADAIESVQKRALRIIYPTLDYGVALNSSGLKSLLDRRIDLATKFVTTAREIEPLGSIIPQSTCVPHGYSLRSGTQRVQKAMLYRTERLNKFATVRYA